jgi:hypothetical protein
MTQARYPSHSADVALWLDCGLHGRVELCRVSSTMVEAKNPRHIPPCEGFLEISVDGHLLRKRVSLPRGISAQRSGAMVRSLETEPVSRG